MPFKFNPITANLDLVNSSGSSPSYSEFSNGSISGAFTLDWSNGLVQAGTVTGNLTITMANAQIGESILMFFDQDNVGNHTYVFSDVVVWGNPGAPTPSGPFRTDAIEFIKRGTYYTASYVLNYIQSGSYTNTNCLNFASASSQYVNLGNNINPDRGNSHSWSFWCKPATLTGTPSFIGKLAASNFRGYQIWFQSGGKVYFNLQNTYSTNCLMVHTTSVVLTASVWQHIAVTYDGSSSPSGVKIYLNGSSQGLTTDFNNLSATTITTNPLYFGADPGAGSPAAEDFYNGRLDEISYWTGALSSGDVTTIYNGGHSQDVSTISASATLANWWRCGDSPDSTSANGIEDRIGSVNGSVVNGTTIVVDGP